MPHAKAYAKAFIYYCQLTAIATYVGTRKSHGPRLITTQITYSNTYKGYFKPFNYCSSYLLIVVRTKV